MPIEFEDGSAREWVERTPGGMLVCREGGILYANAAALQLGGRDAWAPAEPLEDWVEPGSHEALGRLLAGEPGTRPLSLRHPRAGPQPVLAVGAPVTWQGAPAVGLTLLPQPTGESPAGDTSEHIHRTLMQGLPDGVFVAQDHHFVFANPALPALLGYRPEEFPGLPFDRVLAPAHYPLWLERYDKRVSAGNEPPRSYETAFLRKDGSEVPLDLLATRVRLRGRPAVLGVVRDITERRRTAQELERHRHHLEELVNERTRALREAVEARSRSESFAQTMTDNQPTLLAYIDREMRVQFANRAYLQWFGKSREDVIGRRVPDVLGDAMVKPVPDVYQRVFGGEAVGMPADMRGSGGRIGHFWVYRLPDQRNGEIEGYFFIATDVTEIRLAENQLRDVNAALAAADHFTRNIADNLPVRIAYWDREYRCRFVNRVFSDWYGLDRDQCIGRTMDEIFGPGRRLNEPRVLHALSGEPQLFEREESSADGRRRATTLVHYIPDVKDDEVRGFFVLGTDISDMRRASERLQALNAELVDARNHAESAARAKSAFLANMSHEIRTPMNAIIGLTHLLRLDARDTLTRERLGKVSDAAQHLLHIINDILDLSKIEAGKLELESVDFDLDELLTRCCTLIGDAARAKGLEVVVDPDDLPARLRGDPTRLAQALVNLLSNAVKFTQAGVVKLRCELVDSDASGLRVRFEVSDTGIGIPADRLGRLFDAFEQADTSTTRRFGGTGLGLAITRHLAELMRREIGVASEPGVGSRFWFTVLLQPAAAPHKRENLLAGHRVLVVDDLPDARVVLVEMLRRFGMQVDSLSDGREASARVRQREQEGAPYHVALVDADMPGFDGLATLRSLLDIGLTEPPEVVLLGAPDDAGRRAEANELGADHWITKPVSPSALHEGLLRLLVRSVAESRPSLLQPLAETTIAAQHRGARVLLAEDHPVNQEVAGALLRMAGLEVDVAGDGRVAFEMARSTAYDLILMDMQMPVMDGLEATRAIRALAGRERVPIIAMTANAFDEDRGACLAAGMNDHVSKPVNPRVLYMTLARWLTAEPPLDPVLPGSLAPGLDRIEGLDAARGLALFAGHLGLYRHSLETFVELYGGGAPRLAEGGDLERLMRDVHSLGGAAAAIGAVEIEALAAGIEARLRQAEPGADPALRAELGALDRATVSLAQGLERRLATLPTA